MMTCLTAERSGEGVKAKPKSSLSLSRIAHPKTSPPWNCRPPSNGCLASMPNAHGSSSPKAMCSTGPAPTFAASAIATTVPWPTASCRRAFSPNCIDGL